MSYQDFLTKFRYLDNQMAKWLMRHFYFMFFQGVLMVVFLFWFVNMFRVIDVNYQTSPNDLHGQIQVLQLINSALIGFLMILNAFWLLFIFNIQTRILNTLKELNFTMNRSAKNNYRPPERKD